MSFVKEIEFAGRKISLEFQKYAKQANGSVLVSCQGTQVLVTVCAADKVKEGQDFFPLTVDYFEKFYSAGRIPGGFFKRESKPSERETLIARVIDRPLRPCFPSDYKCDTFITATVVSFDPKVHPAPLSVLGASVALMISDIPFSGPVAAIRLGLKDGQFIIDPKEDEMDGMDLDLNLAAKPGAILMVEAGANFLTEEKMLEAINYGYEAMIPLFELQQQIQKEIGVEKRVIEPHKLEEEKIQKLESFYPQIVDIYKAHYPKKERNDRFQKLFDSIVEELNPEEDTDTTLLITDKVEELKSRCMRAMILEDKVRIDGRGLEEIRPISCETKILRNVHGSALFTRGETQSLSVATLGSGEDEQKLDSVLSADGSKRFMLHYNFPPYAVGEARPHKATGRREIGHGHLAERAISRTIPKKEDFDYTIRLVSEILESNGSSSMATVCAGTMALLDAGVPLTDMVAGIAMGLVKGESNYAVLSDILGDEDHLGDMDFKVCGNEKGITALQMDIKVDGLSSDILRSALEQARRGRIFILGKLKEAIDKPAELSASAPRIFKYKIKPEKIKDLIGPGGKNIKKITTDSQTKIDISDDGSLSIMAYSQENADKALALIKEYAEDPQVGEIYCGIIKKLVDFGAFVEFRPGIEGLCHVSQLDVGRVENVFDSFKEGEEIMVKLIDIDKTGRYKLSRKEALVK